MVARIYEVPRWAGRATFTLEQSSTVLAIAKRVVDDDHRDAWLIVHLERKRIIHCIKTMLSRPPPSQSTSIGRARAYPLAVPSYVTKHVRQQSGKQLKETHAFHSNILFANESSS